MQEKVINVCGISADTSNEDNSLDEDKSKSGSESESESEKNTEDSEEDSDSDSNDLDTQVGICVKKTKENGIVQMEG